MTGSNPFYRALNSIHGRLTLLILAILVPIFLIQIFIYRQRFEAQKIAEIKTNFEIASGLAETFMQFTEKINSQQLAIGFALISPEHPAEEWIHYILRKSKNESPAILDYSWVTPEGWILYSSAVEAVQIDVSDRSFFKEIRAGKISYIGELILSLPGLEPVFTITRGIWDYNGVFRGMVVASVQPDRLSDLFASVREGGRSFLLVDNNGRGVFRYPEREWSWESRDLLPFRPEIGEALKGREQSGTFVRPPDGIKRIYALVPVSSIGWAAGVSVPEREALSAIYRQLWNQALLFITIVLLSIGLSLLVARSITKPLMKLQKHALALGQRSLDSRLNPSGPNEFRDLSRILNFMADELARWMKELELRVRERTAELEKMHEEQKIYTRMLEQSNRELEDFVHVASHDLQEPLRKIQTFADRLVTTSGDALSREIQEDLERMQQAARRMRALVLDLLKYSRVTSSPPIFSRLFLRELVEEAVSDLEVLCKEKEGYVEIAELPEIEADPVQMYQLFQNLVANSLKFRGEQKPVIRISSSSPSDRYCEIRVEDNGIGFDMCYLDKIFKPFRRLHGKNSPYEGTGMGLAICRRIVERHGGSITAKSEPGKGAIFIVRLPKNQPKKEERVKIDHAAVISTAGENI